MTYNMDSANRHMLEDISESLLEILSVEGKVINEDVFEDVVRKMNELPKIKVKRGAYDSLTIKTNGEAIITYENRKNNIFNSIKYAFDALCYALLHNKENINEDIYVSKGTIMRDEYSSYLSRVTILPNDIYKEHLIKYSTNDGYLDIYGMAKKLKVKDSLVVKRGNDLGIWRR